MLEYKLTPHHAGVALWGDFAMLDRLHEFIHHVVEESAYIQGGSCGHRTTLSRRVRGLNVGEDTRKRAR